MYIDGVPPEQRNRFKAAAALKGITLSKWAIEAMVEKLEDELDVREGLAVLEDEEGTVTLNELQREYESRDLQGAHTRTPEASSTTPAA